MIMIYKKLREFGDPLKKYQFKKSLMNNSSKNCEDSGGKNKDVIGWLLFFWCETELKMFRQTLSESNNKIMT